MVTTSVVNRIIQLICQFRLKNHELPYSLLLSPVFYSLPITAVLNFQFCV